MCATKRIGSFLLAAVLLFFSGVVPADTNPRAYVVVVGSYEEESNALSHAQSLSAEAGVPLFIEKVEVDGKVYHRVFTPPIEFDFAELTLNAVRISVEDAYIKRA